VHGVHTLLWSLDAWAATASGPFALSSLSAVFAAPVRVGDPVVWSVKRQNGQQVRLVVSSGPSTVVRADFEHAPAPDAPGTPSDLPSRSFDPAPAVELTNYEGVQGELPLTLDRALATRLFPNLAARLPPAQLAVLLASTRLVGMECPGLHSIFSEIALTFDPTQSGSSLAYEAVRVDQRFALVTLKLASPGASGEVRAFIRPAAREQLSFAAARSMVAADRFAGQRALVVGGSRGLGEVAAKLLAAGGAEVVVTWHRGEADARRLVDEITAGDGLANAAHFNVLEPDATAVEALRSTHLFYFASPLIATGRPKAFSQALFEQFCAYYVSGLDGTVRLLVPGGLKGVFSPSSVFVETTPDRLVEYATAKAAAEFLCGQLQREFGDRLHVAWPRLPKLRTDQTAALTDDGTPDAAPAVLAALLQFTG
jgi:NAD(P)-dependent dehydrogenase (short-subunit alcohol dehydrogenase family)